MPGLVYCLVTLLCELWRSSGMVSSLLCLFQAVSGEGIRDTDICVFAVCLFLLLVYRGMEYHAQNHPLYAYVFGGSGQSSRFLRLRSGTQT